MSILYSKDSIPDIGDSVNLTVQLYYEKGKRLPDVNLSFHYDFKIEFSSSKKITLNGYYGSIAEQFDKIDLEKYRNDKYENTYNIPFDVFCSCVDDV